MALISSASFAYVSTEDIVRETVNVELGRQDRYLIVIFFASLVEMAVAADVCDLGTCSGLESAGVTMGLVSVCAVGLHIVLVRRQNPLHELTGKALAPFCLVLWSVAAGLNTSTGGPYTSSCDAAVPAANGYFSTWMAFFASLWYAWSQVLVFFPMESFTDAFGGDKCDGIGLEAHDQPYQPLTEMDDD